MPEDFELPSQAEWAELVKVEKLLDELTRPIFIWRMARGIDFRHPRMGRSAATRRVKALREARDILKKGI